MEDYPTTNSALVNSSTPTQSGSHDGSGAGDHDQPFFGFRSYPFPTREYLHLLLMRSEVLDAKLGNGRYTDDIAAAAA